MKELFFKNWSLKLLALGSALLFWFIVLGVQNAPQQFETPLEIKPFNLSEQYTVAGALPYAKVKILADKEVQRQLKPDDFEVYVDLKNAEPGKVTSTVYVTAKNTKVTVVSIAPESITIPIEKRVEKEMVVEYEVAGKVKDGSLLKSVKINPEKVVISGAESTIAAIKKVQVLIALNGTENKSYILNHAALVDQSGKPLQGVKISPETIDASIEIVSTQQEKAVPVKPRFTGALKTGFVSKMTVRPNIINLQGDGRILDTISFVETEVIDLDKVTKTGGYTAVLMLPKDVRAPSGNRVEIYLEITEVK